MKLCDYVQACAVLSATLVIVIVGAGFWQDKYHVNKRAIEDADAKVGGTTTKRCCAVPNAATLLVQARGLYAVKLVHPNATLGSRALQLLTQPGIADAPVNLITIGGASRIGKSALANLLVRALWVCYDMASASTPTLLGAGWATERVQHWLRAASDNRNGPVCVLLTRVYMASQCLTWLYIVVATLRYPAVWDWNAFTNAFVTASSADSFIPIGLSRATTSAAKDKPLIAVADSEGQCSVQTGSRHSARRSCV